MEADDNTELTITTPSWKYKLLHAASVATFRAHPISTYRHNLKCCLLNFIARGRREGADNDGIVSWNKITADCMVDKLGFAWDELCEHHDNHVNLFSSFQRSTKDDTGSTSALQEVIACLMDPFLIPRAKAASLIKLLLEGMLASPRRRQSSKSIHTKTTTTRWTPSQLLILKSIKRLWESCPSLNQTFLGATSSLLNSELHHTAHKWNRLLSTAQYLASDCPHAYSTMMKIILEILGRLDAMGQRMRLENATVSSSKFQCGNCRSTGATIVFQASSRRNLGIKVTTLQDLHEHDNILSISNYRSRYQQNMQAMKNGRIFTRCTKCQSEAPSEPSRVHIDGNNMVPNDSDWDLVRARAYKKFHSLFLKPSSLLSLPRNLRSPWQGTRRGEPSQFDICSLLELSQVHYRAPSFRLCLLLVTCSSGRPSMAHCHRLCQSLWSRYGSSKDPIWLRFFSEIVTTWSCFNNREACWQEVMTLMTFIRRLVEEEGDADTAGNVQESYHRHRPIFRCLAYVLSKRSKLFEMRKDEICQDLRQFAKYLEVHCGEIERWFAPQEIQGSNIASEIAALQRLGILGLTSMQIMDDDVCIDDESINSKEALTDESLRHWPFSPPFDLCSAYQLLGRDGRPRFNDWDKLLTDPDFDNNLEFDCEKDPVESVGPPIGEYIHDSDLLLQIFRFCDYSDLVQCQLVCHAWQRSLKDTTGDVLWKQAYLHRFPIVKSDPCLHGSDPSMEKSWKKVFSVKLLHERNLLHRRHSATGYKHRTCPYLGCYHVIKSAKLESIHLAFHDRTRNVLEKKISPSNSKLKEDRKRTAGHLETRTRPKRRSKK